MLIICPNCGHVHDQAAPKVNKITQVKKANDLKRLVFDYYGVTETAVLSRCRKEKLAACRHMAIAIIRKYTGMSQEDIGKMFKRDHTSILHAEKRLKNSLFTKQDLYYDFLNLKSVIESNQLRVAV
jgi:chromosomal replication initiator protein